MKDAIKNAVPADGVKLRLQRLSGPPQVLALGALAALQSSDGSFTTRAISDLQNYFRLPALANPSATLGRLRRQELVMRPSNSSWALTPKGEAHLNNEATHLPTQTLATELDQISGSEFGEQHHALIPPFLGPMGTAPGLARILDRAPFEQNVMLITRFPKGPEDHFAQLIPKLRDAVSEHGLILQVASDGMAEDTLWANVVTYMWACKYAIVLMDSADGVLNSNVLIEIGGMLMTGRRCAILRDGSVPTMPSDLVGHIYKPTDLSNHEASLIQIHKWIRDDLALSECPACP